MTGRIALVAMLIVVGLAAPVGAVRNGDPEDMDGKLDIGLTRFVEPEEGIAQATIVTYESWGCAHLGKGRGTTLRWLFDGRGDRRFDLVGTFECRRKQLLFDLRSRNGSNMYESIEVRRRGDSRTALVRFPTDLPELERGDITMIAVSNDVSGETCQNVCRDRAPDKGRLRFND
ncbi:MAG TPA: hypothetical protein VNP73_01695 [Actinomycetota bacterium]|nr:hypothetical protein [Actinomycetota bacterium]